MTQLSSECESSNGNQKHGFTDANWPPARSRETPEPRLSATRLFKWYLQTKRTAVAEVDGGYRVDVEYSESKDPERPPIRVVDETGLGDFVHVLNRATVESGSDWLFVSDMGVMSFDSRLTFRFSETADAQATHCFVTARLRGKANLAHLVFGGQGVQNAEEGYARWLQDASKCVFPVVFSIVVDVPASGFESDQNAMLEKLHILSSDMFVGHGTASGVGSSLAITNVDVDVYRIS